MVRGANARSCVKLPLFEHGLRQLLQAAKVLRAQHRQIASRVKMTARIVFLTYVECVVALGMVAHSWRQLQ
jgi:hypothetical protein